MEFFSNLLSPIESLLQFVLGGLYNVNSLFGLVSYGYAIILLTIIVKFLLYPLTVKQVKSMKAMQELSPKLKKLQEKYKDNPQVMQQKVAALYKDAGVNPLAGCLPLLVQMPILMGMYYSLYNLEYPSADAAQFLWLPSLSEADPYYILPILNVLTTFYQTRQTSDTSNPQMRIMMLVMPLFIGFISLNFPSGLVLYWVVMNLCQILQQWWIYREGGPAEKAKAAVRSKEEA
ncbi:MULTISPECIES: YidC/Oxa1 family membrane protein insertase [unclassified Selenomonas]|uniref:YidC/Oxa1 family membrane protein insertase n=1 Tax=unclassified Selenomonas TaxID=2637378 RepID=UPI00049724E0|nr:YidC/Oxa1 family membrane protein insertase [Selenomonas ruminantium]